MKGKSKENVEASKIVGKDEKVQKDSPTRPVGKKSKQSVGERHGLRAVLYDRKKKRSSVRLSFGIRRGQG